MLQHDLKIYEARFVSHPDPRFFAWCICGGWTYESKAVNKTVTTEHFLDHLQSVQEIRRDPEIQRDLKLDLHNIL